MSEVTNIPPVTEGLSAYSVSADQGETSAQVSKPEAKQVEEHSSGGVRVMEQVKQQQQAEQTTEKQSKSDKLIKVLTKKNVSLRNVRLEFEVDKETEEVIISVLDRKSGELIREIPPEEMRDLARVLKEEAKGSFVDSVT